MKKLLFMVGQGDTGKSQLKALTERFIGRVNFIGIDMRELKARFDTGNIYNNRLAGSSDMSSMMVDELKVFKCATGGDSLFAEFKCRNGFRFTYDGLLWFCMNRLPKFGGDGDWVYDRIMEIRCDNVIPKDKQDKQLLDKLYAERGGIVYKAIIALKNVIANGYRFTEPSSVVTARREYKSQNYTPIAFWNECVIERREGKINDGCTVGKVYDVYRAWCGDNNHGYAKTAREFRDEICNMLKNKWGTLTIRRSVGIFFQNYTLAEFVKLQYSRACGYEDTPPLMGKDDDIR